MCVILKQNVTRRDGHFITFAVPTHIFVAKYDMSVYKLTSDLHFAASFIRMVFWYVMLPTVSYSWLFHFYWVCISMAGCIQNRRYLPCQCNCCRSLIVNAIISVNVCNLDFYFLLKHRKTTVAFLVSLSLISFLLDI